MDSLACLIVEKGAPFESGTRIDWTTPELILGRACGAAIPDLGFTNFFVSRRHCCLKWQAAQVMLCDLGSKHGTFVNGKQIAADVAVRIYDGDSISLASGIVVLRLGLTPASEQTMELDAAFTRKQLFPPAGIALDPDKRECSVDGKVISLTHKEAVLLDLLLQRGGNVVSYADIKAAVWPERHFGGDGAPDVGVDEMNVLIYRLRRKLMDSGRRIRTIRGQGCLIEL